MTVRKPIDESLLQSYLDGEIPREEMADLELRLADDSEANGKLADYRAQLAALHRAYDPVYDAPLPERWHDQLGSGNISRQNSWRWLAAAAAILAFLVGGLAGWQGPRLVAEGPGPESFARRALGAHAVYVVEKRHPVEVHADEQAHLVAWLSKRIGQDLKAPDLQSGGFTLMGGRLLADGDQPIAQFMYENAADKRITLYLRREAGGGESAFRVIEDSGLTGFYWVDPPLAFAMVGALPRSEMLALSRLVYQQIEQDAT